MNVWVWLYLVGAGLMTLAGLWAGGVSPSRDRAPVRTVRLAALLLGFLWPAIVLGFVIGFVWIVVAEVSKAVSR